MHFLVSCKNYENILRQRRMSSTLFGEEKYKKSLFIIVCFCRMFDVEGTGRVSVAELREVLTSLGEKLTEDEVEELFSEGEIGNAALRTSHV